jgi:hypothetical protein
MIAKVTLGSKRYPILKFRIQLMRWSGKPTLVFVVLIYGSIAAKNLTGNRASEPVTNGWES